MDLRGQPTRRPRNLAGQQQWRRGLIGLLLFLAIAVVLVIWLLRRRSRLFCWQTINVNGLERRYLLRSSDAGACAKPLLLCFHGGRAQVELLALRSGIAETGERQGCMVVFPEAEDGWTDLRP